MKSMTGYGRTQEEVDGYEITVEFRSVNHRYFEFSPRVPRHYGYLEEKLKHFVREQVSRGKVDAYVAISPINTSDTKVHINHQLAQSYLEELSKLAENCQLENNIALSHMTHFSDIFVVERVTEDEEAIWEVVQAVAQQALVAFIAMRSTEGNKMKTDIISHLKQLEDYTIKIEALSPITVADYRSRLYEKLQELLGDYQINEQRLLTEAAVFAEKTAVDEETVRLHCHIDQMHLILKEEQPVGRKLDFLIQELNRETNTIGSKSQNSEVNHIVVEMKSEIEKIREQVQNIE